MGIQRRNAEALGVTALLCLVLLDAPAAAEAGPNLEPERRSLHPLRERDAPRIERRDDRRRDDERRERERRERESREREWRDRDRDRDWQHRAWRDHRDHRPRWTDWRWNDRHHHVRPDRRRVYRDLVILRPYGPWYHGYGRHHRDQDAYLWLGLTGITLGILDLLNEPQLRALEDAQIAATAAPIGAPVIWRHAGAGGSVLATREGWSETGRYCREFLQTVEIGGRAEQAYGTACRQPDGSWQVTSP
jgi:hypothetical protein